MSCPIELRAISRTVQANRVAFMAVAVICGVAGYALVGSFFLAPLGAPLLAAQVVIAALLGDCELEGITRELAAQAAIGLGLAAAALPLVGGGGALLAIVTALSSVLGAFGASRVIPAADASKLAIEGARAGSMSEADAEILGIAVAGAIEGGRLGQSASAGSSTGMATVDTIVGRITIPGSRVPPPEAWARAYVAALDEALAATEGTLDVGAALARQLANDRDVITNIVRRSFVSTPSHMSGMVVLRWLADRTAALPRWRSALSPMTRDDGVAFIQSGNLALRIKRRQQETAAPEAPPQQSGAAGPLVIGALLLAAFFR